MRSNNSKENENEPGSREKARDSNSERWHEPPPFSTRLFSEGIRIEHEGPVRNFACTSFLEYGESPRNYKESVGLVLRMVPIDYCSTLVVNDPQPLMYFQEIRFKPKWTVRRFEETVFSYPKEARKRYVSTVTYDPDSRPRTFVSGLCVCAPVNSADLGQPLTQPTSPVPEVFHNHRQNGTEDVQRPMAASPTRYQSTKVKLMFDENANLFCATKDFAVNGV